MIALREHSLDLFFRLYISYTIAVVVSALLFAPLLYKNGFLLYFYENLPNAYFYIKSNLTLNSTFNIPGVLENFRNNYGINGSLWCMPLFFGMYAWTIVTFCLNFYKQISSSRILSMGVLIGFLLMSYYFRDFLPDQSIATLECRNLVFGFLLGIVCYTYKDSLSIDIRMLIGFCLFAFLFRHTEVSYFMNAILIFYSVLFLSTVRFVVKRKLPINLSMGVFLYSFPVQQLISSIFANSLPIFNFLLSTFVALILAYFSAKYIESFLYGVADNLYKFVEKV